MLIDILVRAIIIARVRGWGFWMFRALWDTAFQVAVSPFSWAVEKGKEGAGRIRNQIEARAAYGQGDRSDPTSGGARKATRTGDARRGCRPHGVKRPLGRTRGPSTPE